MRLRKLFWYCKHTKASSCRARLIYDSDSRHYSALLKADSIHIARTTSYHTTVLHCIALYNIVMWCTVLHFITLCCTLLHYLHWIALYCTTLDCIALYNTLGVKLTSVCQCGHLSRKSATNSHKQGKNFFLQFFIFFLLFSFEILFWAARALPTVRQDINKARLSRQLVLKLFLDRYC